MGRAQKGQREREIHRLTGGLVRDLRRSRGLSLDHLASLADIDRSYLARIERGDAGATGETLERLANELGMTLAAFYAAALTREGHRG